MTAKRECLGKIYGTYRDVSGRVYKCSRPATVERDGKWFCWQHDPVRAKADKEKRWAADKAKTNRRAAMWKRRARNAKLAELVTLELAAMLERLGSLWGWPAQLDDRCTARALAARIREALETGND